MIGKTDEFIVDDVDNGALGQSEKTYQPIHDEYDKSNEASRVDRKYLEAHADMQSVYEVPKPNMPKKVPIFIGASDHPCDRIQEKILAYTLHRNSSRPLDITFLRPSMFPGVSAFGWGTPFTGLRYVIPKLMGFKDKAIYMDMINFRDISEFYEINLHGKPFGMVWDSKQTRGKGEPRGSYCDSMMLMDCSQTENFFDWEEVHSWGATSPGFKWIFMKRLRNFADPNNHIDNNAVQRIDSRWNCFDGDVTDGKITWKGKEAIMPEYKLNQIFHLHLTALSYQPWHSAYLMSAKATHRRTDITDYWWQLVDEVRDLDV